VSSSAYTSFAITAPRSLWAEAGSIIARRHRIELVRCCPTHDLLQLLPLLVGQPVHTDRLGHYTPVIGRTSWDIQPS